MFQVNGKEYCSCEELTKREEYNYIGEWIYPGCEMTVHRDVHGRRVLHLKERFPCFDSWDYLNEKRYYHWYFVAHECGVAMVYAVDEKDEVEVTEDIDAPTDHYIGVTGQMRREIEKSGILKRE